MPSTSSASETSLAAAGQYYRNREYEPAITAALAVYSQVPPDSPLQGRVARDIGAGLDRLGEPETAGLWVTEAFRILHALATGEPNRPNLRERGITHVYMGVIAVRSQITGIGAPGDLPQARAHVQAGLSDLRAARRQAPRWIDRRVDQYDVNAARRCSIITSITGSPLRGLGLGLRAVGLAFMSESPRLDTANPDLTRRQRLAAKTRALLGGVAAVGVSLVAPSTPGGRGAKLAYKLANRVL